MKTMQKLQRLLVSGAIAAVTIMPALAVAEEAKRPVAASIEAIASKEAEKSYPRLNLNYTLPGNIEGYTWIELYTEGQGYFGRTSLCKPVSHGFSVEGEIEYLNQPVTNMKLGVSKGFSLPHGAYAKLGIMPLGMDTNGKLNQQVVVTYFASAKLKHGFSVSSFGEANLNFHASPSWGYGEIKVAKDLGRHVSVSYNPALRPTASGKPHLEHRANLEVRF